MAADEAGEKTEQPTPRRRQEAREEGQVAHSTDLTAAISLLAGLVALNMLGPGMYRDMIGLVREMVDVSDIGGGALHVWASRTLWRGASILFPFLALLLVITALGALAQTGFVFTWKRVQPKLENISPTKGVKRLFSLDSVTRTLMGVFKMALIGLVAYVTLAGQLPLVLNAPPGASPGGILNLLGAVVFTLGLRMALVLLLLGVIDYVYQRYRLEKKLRMTKQEVKDELKRMEGDPLLKQRRRQVQARIAMQRVQTDVPKADVVVTNPTHYAVALRYDESTMAAPHVLAKGRDHLALRIRLVAQSNGVPIVERPPLARSLYATVEVGQQVSPEHYRAVAEVLAYVYQLSGRAAG